MCANRSNKVKKISFTLPEREGEMLKSYAAELGISRQTAVKRMVREALKQYKASSLSSEPRNQLGLFDTLQIDIFNNASKISE